ncbi:MAG: Tol-Pal system beta propeller repeat protein TolB [Deltaproteobacteria bacterium]|nr:Tol-Pal system beta propeller repeat protein TolB [Deltaproteobacteria bacterium]MBN2845876.1 Tol-Pal system beta propeller repeat protein TolB [Deltaproteobacteria bacterium]
MRAFKGLLVVFFTLFLCLPAWGKVYIDIDSPAFQQFPTAIPDFRNMGTSEDREGLSRWFSEHLSSALDITGYFRMIEKGAFLEDPNSAGITAEETKFSDWSVVGADFLIKGGFNYDGKKLSVEFRLFDVVEGKLITGKKYWGKIEEKKAMMLRFVGEILHALTGERGVFDTKIAFVGKRGNESEIYTVNFDGTDLQKITNFKSLSLLPHWSPDANRISLTSYLRNNPDYYIVDLRNGKVKRTSEYVGLNLSGPWSAHGEKALLVLSKEGNEEIYTITIENGKLERLTNDPSIDVSPSWSPDDKSIAFVSNRSGSPQVFIMDAEGKNARRLTFEGSYNTSPAWSPKGKKIVYEGSSNGSFQLFTIDEDGNNAMQITFERGGAEDPCWSPDGRYLAFSSKIGQERRICIVNSNGLNLRVLDEIEGIQSLESPSWSPHLNLY